MATLFKLDGSILEVKPKKKHFTYKELQDFIKLDDNNAMVEIVPLPDNKSIIVNEEGKLIGLEKNENATEFWKKVYPIEKYPENNDELIVGNALVCDEKELE